ncbi:MAG: GGDEF domain-containing protein [Emcibacter sp.]|nr:GGDEF domain-containing protein [Emcibacter sp.]
MIHKRIGVEPKLYLSAVRTLKEIVVKMLTRFIDAEELLEKTLDALDKLIYFDTTLVFDAYIESLIGEIKSAKAKSEKYASSLEEKVAERTQQLEELAKTDPLTGIYNQRAMHEMLRRDIAVAKRRKTILCLVYFDVDNFKEINDKLGHIEGDNVLRFVGQSLLSLIRKVDIPCRYGGDEFVVILPECDIVNAVKICEKLVKVFNDKYPDFSLSIGLAQTEEGQDYGAEQLIKIADKKMYLSKKEVGSYITS